MIINFDIEEQDFYLNIKHEDGLLFIIDNCYDGKAFEISLSDYLRHTNERYSQYTIPTSVFDTVENGSYHYRIINADRKRLISGHLTARDANYAAVNYETQLENLKEVDNKKADDFSEQMGDWFD